MINSKVSLVLLFEFFGGGKFLEFNLVNVLISEVFLEFGILFLSFLVVVESLWKFCGVFIVYL